MDTVKELTYKKRGEDIHYPPLRYYTMGDKTLVAFYQGFRGGNPELDFIVKYKEKGKRLRTPSHTHWIVDLLVKSERNKEMVGRYIDDMIEMYENVEPFKTHNERDSYELVFSPFANEKYNELNGSGYYSMETLTTFIELFSKCEKQTKGAFMFRNLLELVKEYTEGKKDFYQLVGYSKRV